MAKSIALVFAALSALIGCVSAQKTHILLVSTVLCDHKCPYNYGVEADIFRAYHLLIKRGVPQENIIVMTPDNFTNHEKNPWPGHVYDSPSKGVDLRKNVKIDYTGNEVTRENILAVLMGKKNRVIGGTGRVIRSSPKDNIFMFLAGHGDLGALMMPDLFRITAMDLNQMVQRIHKEGHYKHLVFYILSCLSGSLFSHLDSKLNALILTSANGSEFSAPLKAVYVPEATKIVNQSIAFGTEFGQAWFEALEQADEDETLGEQFTKIRNNKILTTGHPSAFGNDEIRSDRVSVYFNGKGGSSQPQQQSQEYPQPEYQEQPEYQQEYDYNQQQDYPIYDEQGREINSDYYRQ